MLVWLAEHLVKYYSGFNVFSYLTFRAIVSLLTALFISLWMGPRMIAHLQKLSFGQVVRNDGPESHFSKRGTPTMGGIMILTAIVISVLLWAYPSNPYVWCVLVVLVGYGVIGFVDDYRKVVRKDTKGLIARWKYFWMSVIALGVAFALYLAGKDTPATQLVVPFFKDVMPQLGLFYILLAYFVIVGTGNAVNLTDGLDGLAIMPTVFVAGGFALAALALADAAGLPRASSLKALTTFTGLPHRFEVVLEHNGVRWVNDSKATNVGSTEAALNGLHVDGTLHLLLGGDGKSADFSPLARYLNGDNVRLYCFGRDGAQLAALRPEVAEQTETMEQAMRLLATRVQPGDMVLLSPACASLDQFKNFEQRGNEFARLAKELG